MSRAFDYRPRMKISNRGVRLTCYFGAGKCPGFNHAHNFEALLPAHYSAGKRDRGKNSSVPLARAQQKPSCEGQGGAEGPDAGPIAEERAEGPRRLGRTSAPIEKSFRQKLKTRQRYYTRIRENRKSPI